LAPPACTNTISHQGRILSKKMHKRSEQIATLSHLVLLCSTLSYNEGGTWTTLLDKCAPTYWVHGAQKGYLKTWCFERISFLTSNSACTLRKSDMRIKWNHVHMQTHGLSYSARYPPTPTHKLGPIKLGTWHSDWLSQTLLAL
jgi:hypothetical protein